MYIYFLGLSHFYMEWGSLYIFCEQESVNWPLKLVVSQVRRPRFAPLGFHLAPTLFLELAPELPGGVTAHVPTGLEQRWSTRQGTTGVHEVHRVGAPALGVPVEPSRTGGLGVLNPGVLLHRLLASTLVLAEVLAHSQAACCCGAEISEAESGAS